MAHVRTLWRWGWRSLGIFTILIVCALWLLLGTSNGRLWLVSTLVEQLQSDDLKIELHELRTDSLGHWQFAELTIELRRGKLLNIKNAELLLNPVAIIKGQLLFRHIHSQEVTVFSLAEPDLTTVAKEEPSWQFELPQSPLRITIRDLGIERLNTPEIGRPEKPLPTQWALQASCDLFAPFTPPTLNLTLHSLGSPVTQLQLNSTLVEYHNVKLQGQLHEQKGGYIGTVAGLPEAPVDADFAVQIAQGEQQWDIELLHLKTQLFGHDLAAAGTVFLVPNQSLLRIAELSVQTDEQHHLFKGAITPDDVWLQGTLNAWPLDLISPWIEQLHGGQVSGKINMSWLYSKPESWPEVSGSLVAEVDYAQKSVTLDVVGELKDRILQLNKVSAAVDAMQFEVDGRVDWFGDSTQLRGTARNVSTDIIAELHLPVPHYLSSLSASAKVVQVQLAGQLKDPQVFIKTAIDGTYRKQAFAVQIEGSGNRRFAKVDALVIETGGGDLSAHGHLDWLADGTDLTVEFRQVQESLLNLVPDDIPLEFAKGLSFVINGDAKVQGQLSQPKISSNLTVEGQYAAGDTIIPYVLVSKGQVQVGNLNRLRVFVDSLSLAFFGNNVFSARGTYSKEKLDFVLDVAQLPVQTLAALGWQDISGEAEAHIELAGNFQHPQIKGYANYKDSFFSAGDSSKSIPLTMNFEFTTDAGILNLRSRYYADQESVGDMLFRLPLASYLMNSGNSFPLALSAKGHMDFAVSKWLLDPELHHLKGMFKADIDIKGTLSEPKVFGAIQLREGSYYNQMTGTQWDRVEGDMVADGSSLQLTQLQAHSGEHGYVKLQGNIDWAKNRRQDKDAIKLTLTAQDAVIVQRRDLFGEVSGNIDFSGSFSELWLTGQMSVSPLNANIDSAIRSNIPTIEVSEIQHESEPQWRASLPKINLDLTLNADQQAFIRGRGLNAELQGQFRLQGDLSSPRYLGVFRTRRGKLELFGKRFQLEKGEVRFSNDAISLLIPAVYKSSEIEIRAELYGTSDEPKLSLTSIPSLPEDEIFARLIFGKSVQEITAFEAIRLAGTINTLKNGGGYDPVDHARDLLGVDSLNIEGQQTDNGSGLSVGIGKYINEKVYLELKKTPNPAQPWQATVEIELTPRLRLESGTRENGGGGAELLWKKDY